MAKIRFSKKLYRDQAIARTRILPNTEPNKEGGR